MNAIRLVAIALIVAGVLGLIYGGFSFTKETHQAKLGPIELSVKEKQTVNVPLWAGVARDRDRRRAAAVRRQARLGRRIAQQPRRVRQAGLPRALPAPPGRWPGWR